MLPFFGMELLNLMPNTLSMAMESEAQRENLITFSEMFNRFSNLAITRMNWTGLPDTVSERFLNISLYLFGQAAFFKDPDLGYVALPCTIGQKFNIYYDPTEVNAYSFNMTKQLKQGQFSYVRTSPTGVAPAFAVFTYTRKMADILRTIEVLARKMKQPYLILCDEKERMTFTNMIKKVQDNEIMILGAKEFGINKSGFELVQTPSPTDLAGLWDTYHNLEYLLYTALGINSPGVDKRERLVTDEARANNMVIEMSIEIIVKELKFACQRINQMYPDLDVDVEIKTMDDYSGGEAGGDGDLYDRTAKTGTGAV